MIHAVRATGDKAQMKGGEEKQREKGENKIKCSKREIGESGVKREEAQDRLSDKYVRCMLQFTAPPHMTTVFGTLPKDIAFFSFGCAKKTTDTRHQSFLLLHHIFSPPCLQKKEKKKKGDNSDSEGEIQQSRMR